MLKFMRIIDPLHSSVPVEVSDEFIVPYADTRFPSKYKKLTSYTLNWHTRLVMESVCRPTLFVTLTYNQEHYLENRLIENDIRKTLKDDWQKFLKRLRMNLKYYELGCEDFGSYVISERGDDGRLHFHALFFGFPYQSYPGKNAKGQRIDNVKFNKYTEIIDKSWHQGFVYYEGACQQNIKYVTKYIHKRVISPDYISLKTRGLGLSYLTESRKKYLHDNKYTSVRIGNKDYYLPRYLKQKIFDPLELKEVNEKITYDNRTKIVSNIPSSFERNRHYVYYQNLEQFISVFGNGCDDYLISRDKVLRNVPYEKILSFLDFNAFIYDHEKDTILAIPIDDYLKWYYLKQRYRENLKYNSVFTKRL